MFIIWKLKTTTTLVFVVVLLFITVWMPLGIFAIPFYLAKIKYQCQNTIALLIKQVIGKEGKDENKRKKNK